MKRLNFLIVFCLALCFGLYAQTAMPYIPLKTDFGGKTINDLSDFVPSTDDYTLEVQGTKNTAIIIAFSNINYTPTADGTIRFVQKNGKVYVFENGVYKAVLTPNPEFTVIGENIIQNPSFEDVAETLASGRWKPSIWDTWDGQSTTWGGEVGETNVRENGTYRSDGTKSIIMHSNARELLQQLPINALETAAYYLLTYDYWTSSGSNNGGANYKIHLRKKAHEDEIKTINGHTTLEATTVKSSFSVVFGMADDVPAEIWFVLQRNASKVDWLDNFKLHKVQAVNKGITGVSSVVYLDAAYAPEDLSFENDDYIDMTERIENPGFDNNTEGWTITASDSKISTAEKAGGLIPSNQKHLQFWVRNGGVNGILSQSIDDLPNGKYVLKVAVSSTFEGSVLLCANSEKTAIISGLAKYYEVSGIVFDNSLQIGLEIATTEETTIDLDDFQLFYYGIDVAGYLQTLNTKITEAKADTVSMHTNALSLPGYNNLQQYRDAFDAVNNRPNDNTETLVEVLALLDAAMKEYASILEEYGALKTAYSNLEMKLGASSYPDKTFADDVISSAKAIYENLDDQRGTAIESSVALIDEKTAILDSYLELELAIISAIEILDSDDYPGKPAYQEAISLAQEVYNNPEGKNIEVTLIALTDAGKAYYYSQFVNPAVQKTVSWVDTSFEDSEKFLLRVDGKPFYLTAIQVRLDKLKGYLNPGFDAAARRKVIERAALDGFNTIELPIYWSEVEPEKDKFDWTILDEYLGYCKEFGLKLELLWFSWSSGGRIQYLSNNNTLGKKLRTPDYVCSLDGKSEYNMLHNSMEYSLDWRDTNLRDRETYVLSQVMEHIALWDANNGNPNTVIGIQLGNEARHHGANTATSEEIIDWYHHVGSAVKESKYVVWTRMNCVYSETQGRIDANEARRSSSGTNIDFVGIDCYREWQAPAAIFGNVLGRMNPAGKNYEMIMEVGAELETVPIAQMAAVAAGKAFCYYDMAGPDNHGLYDYNADNSTLIEKLHVTNVRQVNKILNLANQEIATKAHGQSMHVFNYLGDSSAPETGLEGIVFMPSAVNAQGIVIRRNSSEIVLLSTHAGTFTIPSSISILSASQGFFDENNEWVKEDDIAINEANINMPVASAVLLKIKATEEDVSSIIKNPSFEGDTYNNGTYVVPTEWTLNATLNSPDGQLKIGDAAHGQNRYYIWTKEGGSVDFYQDIILSEGEYTLKAALRPNMPSSTYLYVDVDNNVVKTIAAEGSWLSWGDTSVPFTVEKDATTIRIGVMATNAVMIDNFRLYKSIGEVNSGISYSNSDSQTLKIRSCPDGIYIAVKNDELLETSIYSISGQLIKNLTLSVNELFIPLQKGVYIIENQKVIVN